MGLLKNLVNTYLGGEKAKANVMVKVATTIPEIKASGQNPLNVMVSEMEQIERDTLDKANDNVQQAIERVKEVAKKIISKLDKGQLVHMANKVNPLMLIMRGSVIGVLQANILGLATAFDLIKQRRKTDKAWDKIEDKWWILGGKKSKLDSNVDRGRYKTKKFLKLVSKMSGKKYAGFDGDSSNFSGAQVGEFVVNIAGIMGAGAGLMLTNPATAPSSPAVGSTAGFLGSIGHVLKAFGKSHGAKPKDIEDIPENQDIVPQYTDEELLAIAEKIDEDSKIGGMPKPIFFTILGLVILTIVVVILKKNKTI